MNKGEKTIDFKALRYLCQCTLHCKKKADRERSAPALLLSGEWWVPQAASALTSAAGASAATPSTAISGTPAFCFLRAL